MATPMEVLIIGGGTTGLLLAQGLKLKNIKSTVFEREDAQTYRDRPREWGMTLHWAQEHLDKCIPPEMQLHLDENICCDPFFKGETVVTHYNGQTGEKLMATRGQRPRRISRRKLRNYLSQGLDVKYGYKLAKISQEEDRVVAEFEDGFKASGTVLVGCDGSKSSTRELFLGAERSQIQDIDIQMFNISCRFPKDIAILQRDPRSPIIKLAYHPRGVMWFQSIQDVQDPDRPETWLFQNFLSWAGSPRPEDFPDQASRMKYWQELAQGFSDPWKTTGVHLPKDLNWTTDRTTMWAPFDWEDAKLSNVVTLAGDAAHTMPPHRGQGLNNALEDASKLADGLESVVKGEKTLPEALRAYEADMRKRVLVEIPLSKAQAQMIHSFDTLMEAPIFKHGIDKYRGERAAAGLDIETAA